MNNIFFDIPTYIKTGRGELTAYIVIAIIIGIIHFGSLIAGFILILIHERSWRHYKRCSTGIECSMIVWLLSMIPFVLFTAVAISSYNDYKKYPTWYKSEIEEVKVDHIYSLEMHNQVSGRFVLGQGYIQSEPYYYYYIETSMPDTYKLSNYKITNDTYVREADTTPKIVERKDANSSHIYILIYVPFGTVINSSYKN